MVDAVFPEHNHLLSVLHQALGILIHAVHKDLVTEVFLHLGDIYHTSVCQFLKFGIVDICTIKCYYIIVAVMTRSKHK